MYVLSTHFEAQDHNWNWNSLRTCNQVKSEKPQRASKRLPDGALLFWSQVVPAQILHCHCPCPGSRAPSGGFGGRPDGYWQAAQWNWCQSQVDTRTTAVCPLRTKGHALAAILFPWISHPSKLYQVAHKPMIRRKSFKIRRGKMWINMLAGESRGAGSSKPAREPAR